MDRPTITTVDGKEHALKKFDGRIYRLVAEFDRDLPQITDVDFIERHAAIVAELYGVSTDDALDLPLEDIMPASIEGRRAVFQLTWSKTADISKNSETDKEP